MSILRTRSRSDQPGVSNYLVVYKPDPSLLFSFLSFLSIELQILNPFLEFCKDTLLIARPGAPHISSSLNFHIIPHTAQHGEHLPMERRSEIREA